MKIQLVDLYAQYLTIKNEIDAAIARTIADTSFIGGDEVSKFEKAFAEFIGVAHCIGCANGTDAIEIVLQTMGIGPGDEVIVPAISWISTSEAVSTVGAIPVFVDVDPDTYCINPKLIRAAINSRTKAIIPVHLYGHPSSMDEIMEIAKRFNILVLEDCAQAHGAEWNGKRVGSFGHAATFSFYPGKNLGAYGDAGGIVTNDAILAEKARMIANHGQKGKHNHLIEGRNSRLDGLQAAILNVKLPYLSEWTHKRKNIAEFYNKNISNGCIVLPKINPEADHVYHLYVIQTKNRDQFRSYLDSNGISTAIHYPNPLPFLECYEHFKFKKSEFPKAYEVSKRIVSIPMYPELSSNEQKKITDTINLFSD